MTHPKHRSDFSFLRTLGGVAAVGVTTFVLFQLHLNFAAAGFIQLLLVMIIATEAGFWEATVCSLAANVCLNVFFVPPLFRFTVDDVQNWIALIVFECSALLVSRLATSARHQRSRAFRNRNEIRTLNKASRQLSSLNVNAPASDIVEVISETFAADSVVLFDGLKDQTTSAGTPSSQLEAETRGAYQLKENIVSSTPHTFIRMLSLDAKPFGALGVQGITVSAVTADALATLVAGAIQRSQSCERAGRFDGRTRIRV